MDATLATIRKTGQGQGPRDLAERVRAQYEAFPYPDYSLLLPLRSQEAYASNSLFAARVLENQGGSPAIRWGGEGRILLAGCGDVYPFMAGRWEPRRHRLEAVDLSARSLRRARLRCLPLLRRVAWRQGNLEDSSFALPGGLAHIDCYGVLHHLANPARVLERFGSALLPGGTARIMVYNSEARAWIRHLQRAFALLGLSGLRPGDVGRARKLAVSLAGVSPALRERFRAMRGDAFANDSRFVDTFLHAREARLGLAYWLEAIRRSGMRLFGVYDRLAELDDLPNPLLVAPGPEAWRDRIRDRRFENNLELWLARPGPAVRDAAVPRSSWLPGPLVLREPPRNWFEYGETRDIPGMARRRLWANFLRRLGGGRCPGIDAWAGRLPPESLQRLGRLGAIFPDDFASRELKELLLLPRHDSMDPPERPVTGPVHGNPGIRAEILAILREGNLPAERLEPAMRRLDAAQRP
jgi:SAM-dependent methyltransferase